LMWGFILLLGRIIPIPIPIAVHEDVMCRRIREIEARRKTSRPPKFLL